jgi:hypothetical protein
VGLAQADLTLLASPHDDRALGIIPGEGEFEIIGRDAAGGWLFVRWEDEDQLAAIEGWVYAPFVTVTSGNLLDLNIR